MKTRILLILLLIIPWALQAEVVRLNNGKTISGTILIQNDDVVIIRDASGARFQYPRSEVQSIVTNEEAAAGQASGNGTDSKSTNTSSEVSGKKTAIRIEAAGGLGTIPHEVYGGAASGSIIIGSRQIAGREITLGGQVGYQGFFLPKSTASAPATYHFLPIALALRLPLIQSTHAPELGASIGYGVALSKSYVGGVYVGADLGYRYLAPSDKRIYVGLYTHFQQATVKSGEMIEGVAYNASLGRALVTAGVKVAFSL